MLSIQLLSFLLFFLIIGLFCLTAINTAFRNLQRKESKKHLQSVGKLFFYRYLSRLFFPNEYEDLYFASIFAQHFTRFCYAILSLLFMNRLHLITTYSSEGSTDTFF